MSDNIKVIKISEGAKLDSSGFFPRYTSDAQPRPETRPESRPETRPETRQKSSLDSSGFFTKKQSLSQPEQPQSPPKRKKEDYDEESYGDEEESGSSIDSMLSEEDITDITKNSSSEILHTNDIKLVKQLNDESINSYLDKPQTQSVATQPVETKQVETQPVAIQQPAQPTPTKFPSNQHPPNTAPMRNDYYSDTDEEVIDMTDNKLYEVLASVLEDVDGNNVSENMAKTNSYLEKLISIFENQQKHSNSDDSILRMSNAIENQNKLLTRIVDIFEKSTKNNQESPKKKNQDINLGEDINLEEENTNSDNNPNIKRVTIPKIIKESTTAPPSLRHRVQIKKK